MTGDFPAVCFPLPCCQLSVKEPPVNTQRSWPECGHVTSSAAAAQGQGHLQGTAEGRAGAARRASLDSLGKASALGIALLPRLPQQQKHTSPSFPPQYRLYITNFRWKGVFLLGRLRLLSQNPYSTFLPSQLSILNFFFFLSKLKLSCPITK